MLSIVIGCGNVGFETVKAINSSGDNNSVYVLSRSYPQHLKEYILEGNKNVHFIPGDLENEKTIEEAFNLILSEAGQADALVVTAGVSATESCMEKPAVFTRKLMLDSYGSFFPIEYSIRSGLLKENASIVAISSTSAHFYRPGFIAYTPAKWALESELFSFREFSTQTINVVAPRTIRNRYSSVFTANNGVEPETVAKVVLKAIHSNNSAAFFVPPVYRVYGMIERCFPVLFDIAFRLKPRFIREASYKSYPITKAAVIGADTELGGAMIQIIKDHFNGEVYGFPSYTEAIAGWDTGIDVVFNCIEYENGIPTDSFSAAFQSALQRYMIKYADFLSGLKKEALPKRLINLYCETNTVEKEERCAYTAAITALTAFNRGARRAVGNSIQVGEVICTLSDQKGKKKMAETIWNKTLSGKERIRC